MIVFFPTNSFLSFHQKFVEFLNFEEISIARDSAVDS
jgi:hypothetical protein